MVSQTFSPASLTTTGNQRNRILSGLYSNIVRRLVEHTRKKELERSCVRSLDSWYKLVFMDQIFLKCYWKDFPRCAAGISWGELERNTCEDKRERNEKQCGTWYYMKSFYGCFYSLIIPSNVHMKWWSLFSLMTAYHLWTINIPVD